MTHEEDEFWVLEGRPRPGRGSRACKPPRLPQRSLCLGLAQGGGPTAPGGALLLPCLGWLAPRLGSSMNLCLEPVSFGSEQPVEPGPDPRKSE